MTPISSSAVNVTLTIDYRHREHPQRTSLVYEPIPTVATLLPHSLQPVPGTHDRPASSASKFISWHTKVMSDAFYASRRPAEATGNGRLDISGRLGGVCCTDKSPQTGRLHHHRASPPSPARPSRTSPITLGGWRSLGLSIFYNIYARSVRCCRSE